MQHIPLGATLTQLLDEVKFGPIEHVAFIGPTSAVIAFLDDETAAAFVADAHRTQLSIGTRVVHVGISARQQSQPISQNFLGRVREKRISRALILGTRLGYTQVNEAMEKIGPVDRVMVFPDEELAFVNFLSISSASKVRACFRMLNLVLIVLFTLLFSRRRRT